MQRRERRIRKTANKKRTIEKDGNMLHGGGNEKIVDYESSTGKQLEVRPSVVVRAKSLQTSQSILAYDEERNNETDDEDENEEDNEEINASFETAAHRSVEFVDVKLIIGEELCLLAEIIFNRNGLQVRKMSSSDELINMMKISADVDNNVFDINEAASESAKREVRELMNNYVPNKTKSTNVEMRIVLNDESPIFSQDSIGIALRDAQAKDEKIKAIKQVLSDEQRTYDDYFLKSGMLYKLVQDEELIVVPTDMQKQIISRAHDRVLSKLSIDDPTKWYKHVGRVQQAVNSTFTRSIDTTPFEMLVGVKMRTKEDLEIRDLINKEAVRVFNDERSDLRAKAKAQIVKLQSENKMTYNLRRKSARRYDVGDLVAIKRTQFGSGLKLKAKFLGPYQVVKVKHSNSYDVQKVGNSDGPKNTTTCAEYMKPWSIGGDDDDDDGAFGPNA
ncbi:hypothetical protein ACLKA7_015293 [Drosophila subpalustris]